MTELATYFELIGYGQVDYQTNWINFPGCTCRVTEDALPAIVNGERRMCRIVDRCGHHEAVDMLTLMAMVHRADELAEKEA